MADIFLSIIAIRFTGAGVNIPTRSRAHSSEEFKIACLQDIARTFPAGTNPFNSGYGNRPTDLVAYEAAGVPPGRVFIINPSGTITTLNKTYKSTYHNLTELVKVMYPPTQEHSQGVSQDYNDWNYWKIPLPELDELQ